MSACTVGVWGQAVARGAPGCRGPGSRVRRRPTSPRGSAADGAVVKEAGHAGRCEAPACRRCASLSLGGEVGRLPREVSVSSQPVRASRTSECGGSSPTFSMHLGARRDVQQITAPAHRARVATGHADRRRGAALVVGSICGDIWRDFAFYEESSRSVWGQPSRVSASTENDGAHT